MKVKQELEKLMGEITKLREQFGKDEAVVTPIKDSGLEARLGDLKQVVGRMLEETEEKVGEHAIPTLAGALALGILIGWVTTHQSKHA